MNKILVIDDDRTCRSMLQWHLMRAGYELYTAANGDEALAILKEQSVDLVITDVVMPGRDGLETMGAIRKRWPETKVIAISGGGLCGAALYINLCLKLGAARVMEKPFSSEELLAAVQAELPQVERAEAVAVA